MDYAQDNPHNNYFYELGKALKKQNMARQIKSEYAEELAPLLTKFWENGGKEKYESTKSMRDANGIPDRQWFAAQLMSIIDEAEITYNAEETK